MEGKVAVAAEEEQGLKQQLEKAYVNEIELQAAQEALTEQVEALTASQADLMQELEALKASAEAALSEEQDRAQALEIRIAALEDEVRGSRFAEPIARWESLPMVPPNASGMVKLETTKRDLQLARAEIESQEAARQRFEETAEQQISALEADKVALIASNERLTSEVRGMYQVRTTEGYFKALGSNLNPTPFCV